MRRDRLALIRQRRLLKPAEWSAGRKVALLTLRGYLVISVVLLIVKAVRLGH